MAAWTDALRQLVYNRAALVSADYVVVPLAPDLHSLQGSPPVMDEDPYCLTGRIRLVEEGEAMAGVAVGS